MVCLGERLIAPKLMNDDMVMVRLNEMWHFCIEPLEVDFRLLRYQHFRASLARPFSFSFG